MANYPAVCVLIIALAASPCLSLGLGSKLPKYVPMVEVKPSVVKRTVPKVLMVPKIVLAPQLFPKLMPSVVFKPLPKVIPEVVPDVMPKLVPKISTEVLPKLGARLDFKVVPWGRRMLGGGEGAAAGAAAGASA